MLNKYCTYVCFSSGMVWVFTVKVTIAMSRVNQGIFDRFVFLNFNKLVFLQLK